MLFSLDLIRIVILVNDILARLSQLAVSQVYASPVAAKDEQSYTDSVNL